MERNRRRSAAQAVDPLVMGLQAAYMRRVMDHLSSLFPGQGVVLLTFKAGADHAAGDTCNYIGNAPRPEMTAALKSVLARWEGRAHDAPAGKQ